MELPIYIYEIDAKGFPTGKLNKSFIERPLEKRGKHKWVSACDELGNEVFGYCELCGKKQKG